MAPLLLILMACTSDPAVAPFDTDPPALRIATLRQIANARGLHIGAAADRLFHNGAEGVEFKAVLSREFSVLTPENDMKHRRLRPALGVFAFGRADSLVAFAEANRMQVRGHTLVWHHANASWLTARTWTPDELRALLVDHITTIVNRYRGRVFAWDVVNEAISDNGTLRPTIWSPIGPDYIELAFRTAHEADPQALLFYNDYDIEAINVKSDSVYAVMSRLLQAGVPVHGIGLQAHFRVGALPAHESMAANIARFAGLGLKVHITELDISIRVPATPEQLQIQAENYRDVFRVCLQHVACQAIVTWGVSDRDTWIARGIPGWGDPLLFDSIYRPKNAYLAIHDLLSQQ